MSDSNNLIVISLINTDFENDNLNKDNKSDDNSVNCCSYLSNYLNNCVLCCFVCLN